MAQTDEEKQKAAEQKDLFGKLEKNDVKVADDAAEQMKESIMNDNGGGKYLGVGVHDVEITSVELVEAKSGTLGMKFNVENENGKGEATFWLSEAALPYTIGNVARIVVHNAPDTGDSKLKAKNFMANIGSAKELFEGVQAFLGQAEKAKKPFVAVLVIEEDDERVYTNKNGEEKPALNRNLQVWKPKAVSAEAIAKNEGATVLKDENGVDLPF